MVFMDFVQLVGGVQQGFGRDATDVQAGAAQRIAAFDHGDVQPKLGRADGADIAAGAGTDDDCVVVCHGAFLQIGPCYSRAFCVPYPCLQQSDQACDDHG